MPDLPSGTVTFLFADVEGSTRLMQELGDGYGPLLGELRQLLRGAMTEAGGHEVDCRADELFAVFSGPWMGFGLLCLRNGCLRLELGRRTLSYACVWVCTLASPRSRVTRISVSMSAVRPGSARPRTAGRSCSRKRPASSWPGRPKCGISVPTRWPVLPLRSGSTSLSQLICGSTFRRFGLLADSLAGSGRSRHSGCGGRPWKRLGGRCDRCCRQWRNRCKSRSRSSEPRCSPATVQRRTPIASSARSIANG